MILFKKINKKMIICNYKYKIKLMIKSKIFNQKKNKLLIKKLKMIRNNVKKLYNKMKIIN